jgi:uncharacterized protein YfcZ (UPF0381/DUF406 family)
MKLIDDLKAYFNRKDQEIERLVGDVSILDIHVSQLRNEKRELTVNLKSITELSTIAMKDFNDLAEHHEEGMAGLLEKIEQLESENASLHEALKLIETTHGEDLDQPYKLCTQAEQLRVIAFDICKEYRKVVEELQRYKEKADGDDTEGKN